MARHRKTFEQVFTEPAPANIKWNAIESMLTAYGAELTEGSGSRVRVELNGVRAVFHRPHPNPEASRPQVRAVKAFLENAGLLP